MLTSLLVRAVLPSLRLEVLSRQPLAFLPAGLRPEDQMASFMAAMQSPEYSGEVSSTMLSAVIFHALIPVNETGQHQRMIGHARDGASSTYSDT